MNAGTMVDSGLSINFIYLKHLEVLPKHSLLSGEPCECSIDIQTGKVVHTGVMFLPELA